MPLIARGLASRIRARSTGPRAASSVSDGLAVEPKSPGTDATRKAWQAGTPAAQIVASWKAGEEAFREKRRKYLLY